MTSITAAIENLTAPGRGVNMGDGWETRRRREPGHDWAVLELGAPGRIEEVVVDTAHFKGNYPDRCFLQAAADAAGSPEEIAAASESWPLLLPEAKLEADKVHVFRDGLADLGADPLRAAEHHPRRRGQPAAADRAGRVMSALFEHSPWVEARADARPSSGDRHADLMAVVRDADPRRSSSP